MCVRVCHTIGEGFDVSFVVLVFAIYNLGRCIIELRKTTYITERQQRNVM